MKLSIARSALWTAMALSFASASGCVRGDPASMSCWSSRAPLPVPRARHALVALGGQVYAIGGSSGSTLARVDRYDPASDAWTRVADMLSARQEFAAGAVNGKIYVACGMSITGGVFSYVGTTEEYDPGTNAWTTRAPCPMADPGGSYGSVRVGGAVTNGLLYAFVTSAYLTAGGATYVYDPATDTWSTKAAPPLPVYAGHSAAGAGGSMYLLTEYYGGDGLFARYDPANDTWAARATTTDAPSATLVGYGGAIYALGGVQGVPFNQVVTDGVYQYSPSADSWAPAGRFANGRRLAAAAVDGDTVYVAGGSSSAEYWLPDTPMDSVEATSHPYCPALTFPPLPL